MQKDKISEVYRTLSSLYYHLEEGKTGHSRIFVSLAMSPSKTVSLKFFIVA